MEILMIKSSRQEQPFCWSGGRITKKIELNCISATISGIIAEHGHQRSYRMKQSVLASYFNADDLEAMAVE
jgi:hypothetical protein